MRSITVLHPSRGRAKMAFNTYNKWRQRGQTNFQYILSLDNDNYHEYYSYGLFDDIKDSNGLVTINENKSAIEAINVAVQHATGDLFVVISDDFDAPPDWDLQLLAALDGKEDFIVKTQDGIQKTLITLPIMDCKYYERFGYIYFGGYNHMFCDQEMTAVGHLLGKVIDLPIMFKHAHYTTGAMQKDLINVKNDATWAQGEALFNERLKSLFGLNPEEIVKSYQEIVWR